MRTEVRQAMRRLRAQPTTVAGMLLGLALGIGANTAVFALAYWTLFRPVPGVSGESRLVGIAVRHAGDPNAEPISYPNLADLHGQLHSLSALAGYSAATPIVVDVPNVSPRYLSGSFVSPNYFDVLGVRPTLGRGFTAADDGSSTGMPNVVISARLWHDTFGANPAAIGRQLTLDGITATIAGVAPPAFRGAERRGDIDVWLPGSALASIAQHAADVHPATDRGYGVFEQLVGRLRDGARVSDVRSEASIAVTRLAMLYGRDDARWTSADVSADIGTPPAEREAARRSLTLLGELAAVVLLIACANVATLEMLRTLRRRPEWQIRAALGATGSRMAAMQAADALVLALLAAPLSALTGYGLTRLFHGDLLASLGAAGTVGLDWRVVGFALCLSLPVCAGTTIGAALGASRIGSPSSVAWMGARAGRRGGRARSILVALQIALALSLLTVALLLAATLHRLRAIPVGFDADRVTSFAVSPALAGQPPASSVGLLQQALGRIAAIPGVDDAALSATAPFTGTPIRGWRIGPAGVLTDSGVPATPAWVSASYFQVMGIPLQRGRSFATDEAFGPLSGGPNPTIILSRSLAQRLFGSADVLGRLVSIGLPGAHPARVIGVAANSRWSSLTGDDTGPMAYLPIPNVIGTTGATFLVRSRLAPAALHHAVQSALDAVGPSLPMFDAARLRERIEHTLAPERLLARLLIVFACLAAGLAAIGLYAVIAFSVTDRTRELGIRIALGATRSRIMRMVIGDGLLVGGAGIALGTGAAVVLGRLVANRMADVRAFDPLACAVAAAAFLGVILIASLGPALHATRADPAAALTAD